MISTVEEMIMLKRVRTATLEIAYEDNGPEAGHPVLLMHGFPYDPRCYDEVVPRMVSRVCKAADMGPWGAMEQWMQLIKVHRPRDWASRCDDLGVKHRNTFCTFCRCHRDSVRFDQVPATGLSSGLGRGDTIAAAGLGIPLSLEPNAELCSIPLTEYFPLSPNDPYIHRHEFWAA
jgi:hypothetical protein